MTVITRGSASLISTKPTTVSDLTGRSISLPANRRDLLLLRTAPRVLHLQPVSLPRCSPWEQRSLLVAMPYFQPLWLQRPLTLLSLPSLIREPPRPPATCHHISMRKIITSTIWNWLHGSSTHLPAIKAFL